MSSGRVVPWRLTCDQSRLGGLVHYAYTTRSRGGYRTRYHVVCTGVKVRPDHCKQDPSVVVTCIACMTSPLR